MGNAIKNAQQPINNLSLNRKAINKMLSYNCIYHKKEDTLFFLPDNPKPATSFDWNGEIWLRLDPQTEEIIGIEIENFEKVFLIKYPELAAVWKAAKPYCLRKISRNKSNNTWGSFVRIILEFLSNLFDKTPQQLVLKESPL